MHERLDLTPAVGRKMVPIMEACMMAGVSRRTIYNWLTNGRIEYIRTAGGAVRIFVDTLWRAGEPIPERRPRGTRKVIT